MLAAAHPPLSGLSLRAHTCHFQQPGTKVPRCCPWGHLQSLGRPYALTAQVANTLGASLMQGLTVFGVKTPTSSW